MDINETRYWDYNKVMPHKITMLAIEDSLESDHAKR